MSFVRSILSLVPMKPGGTPPRCSPNSGRKALCSAAPFLVGLIAIASAICPAAAQQPAPAAGEPVRGGTLTMTVNPEPPYMLSAINPLLQMGMLTTKVMEGLLTYDFNLNPRPQLAESWQVSPDGLTYTFNLRKGVKWHDGKDFTAADVEYSLNKAWKT